MNCIKIITTAEDEETGGIGEEAAKGLSFEIEARVLIVSEAPMSGDEVGLNGCNKEPLTDPWISGFKNKLEIVV